MALGCFVHAQVSHVDVLDIPRDSFKWVFLRAVFGFLSMMCQFFAIFLLPLSLAVLLYFTQPVSASIVNWIFNNESLSSLQIVSIASAMLGVVILTNPTMVFPFLSESDAHSYQLEDYEHFNLGVFVALFGSVCSGFAYLTMRKTGNSVHPLISPMYFGAFSVVANFFLSVATGDQLVEKFTGTGIVLLLSAGVFGWLAQEGVSKAI
jgi:drug/metabolite transporter (DMT)-like permease